MNFLLSFKKNPKAIWLSIIVLVTFLAYSRTLAAGFTNWDDNVYVTENVLLKNFNWANVKEIFTSSVSDVYSPLTILTFALEYHFFGPNPAVFHFNNLIFHLAVVCLIFFLIADLGFPTVVAGISALVFGLHPIHVESVAWITERKDVLYAFFYLLALRSYLQYLRSNKKVPYALSVLFCFLSMLSKPMALSLPLVLFILDWWTKRKITASIVIDKIIYFAIVAGVGWITYSQHARVPGKSLLEAATVWVYTFSFYIEKFFWPVGLTPHYQLPEPIHFSNWPYLVSFIVFGLCIVFFVLDRSRLWRFAITFYFFSIFFILRFDQGHDLNIVADRFMYLPCLGFCLLLGSFLHNLLEKQRGAAALLVIVIIFIAWPVKTVKLVEIWRDSMSLWTHVIKNNPKLAVAYNNRGEAYSQSGLHDLAIKDYNKALELDPLHVSSYNNRADALIARGETNLAIKDYDKSIELNRNINFQAYYNRGNIHLARQEFLLALEDYNRAIEINPAFPQVYNNRGIVYLNQQKWDLALENFNKTLQLDPRYGEGYNNRGYALLQMKKYSDALKDFETSLRFNPKNAMAYYNRGNVFRLKGSYDQAVEDLSKAISINPSLPMAYWNRALSYAEKKQWAKALADVQTAQTMGIKGIESYVNFLNDQIEGR